MAIEDFDQVTIAPAKLRPFSKFIMSIGELPTSYLDSLSYAEQVTWFCDYLQNNVIPALNNNAEALEEVQDLMTELQTYVDNYFTNLDVQEEINNKLDIMATDGSLTAIIKNYVDPYIDEQNAAINNMRNEVIEIDNKVNSVASGSPAGVYATVAALEAADPDHTKIYVVTATGNWYYYSGSAWTSGGSYQASIYSSDDITPELTSFYENKNILPYNNWIQGKVLNESTGNEQNYANGSYNQEYIQIDNTKRYLWINNSILTKYNLHIYKYNSSKEYLGHVNLNSSFIDFDNTVSYIRVAFYNVNTPVLTVKCLLLPIDEALNLLSYENNNIIKDIYFNTIKTDKIIIPNKYGFRLLPYQIVNAGNQYSSLNFPTIYEMKATNAAVNGGNYLGCCFDYDTTKLQVGDKIYVDTTGSSNFSNLTLFTTTSSSSDTLIATNEGNGIYSFTLTQNLLTAMNNAKGVNNYYPRINFIRQGQTAGTTITSNMRVWINEDFTNLTNYLEDVKEVLENYDNKQTLKVIALGDSITALSGNRSWLSYFNTIQPINIIQNTAVNSAVLTDYTNTIYDGNPTSSTQVNNVLGNQVQKIINNNYTAPDIIMIAIGTNGGINCTEQDIYNSYYDSNGNLISLENVDRKTSAGAFRYCNETLRSLYPNATIFWCSPIQAFNSGNRTLDKIIQYGKNLKALCEYSSVQFIDTQDCGITGYTEYNGSNGLYLIDGLHPNANGAKYMGYYNATKVKEYTEAAKLFNS